MELLALFSVRPFLLMRINRKINVVTPTIAFTLPTVHILRSRIQFLYVNMYVEEYDHCVVKALLPTGARPRTQSKPGQLQIHKLTAIRRHKTVAFTLSYTSSPRRQGRGERTKSQVCFQARSLLSFLPSLPPPPRPDSPMNHPVFPIELSDASLPPQPPQLPQSFFIPANNLVMKY